MRPTTDALPDAVATALGLDAGAPNTAGDGALSSGGGRGRR